MNNGRLGHTSTRKRVVCIVVLPCGGLAPSRICVSIESELGNAEQAGEIPLVTGVKVRLSERPWELANSNGSFIDPVIGFIRLRPARILVASKMLVCIGDGDTVRASEIISDGDEAFMVKEIPLATVGASRPRRMGSTVVFPTLRFGVSPRRRSSEKMMPPAI